MHDTLSRTVVFALVGRTGLCAASLASCICSSVPACRSASARHWPCWRPSRTTSCGTGDGRGAIGPWTPASPQAQFLRFAGLNGLVSLAGNVIITAGLAASGVPVLAANAVAVVVCSLANYVLADRLVFAAASAVLLTAGAADAAVLEPRTLAGWQEYVKATEQRIAREEPKLSVGAPRPDEWRRLRAGELLLSQRQTRRPDGAAIEVPDGAMHHWVGRVFLPGASWPTLLAELQAPTSRRWMPAEVRSMRWWPTAGAGCACSCASSATASSMSPTTSSTRCATRGMPAGTPPAAARRAASCSSTTPGTPRNAPLPEGHDSGFLWRLNAYWRYVPVDGGVLVECESLALSRSVPSLLRPLAAPIIDTRVARVAGEHACARCGAGFAMNTK